MAGLTDQGFEPKTLEELQTELRENITLRFAEIDEVVNVGESSRFGQLIDIFSSEMSLVWEGLEDVYNSYFALTSLGVSLDKALQLVNIARIKAASSQGEIYLIGDANTSVAQGNRFTVTDTTNDFALSSKTRTGTPDITDYLITDTSLAVVVSGIADTGTIDLSFDGNAATINWDDTAAEIKTALEALAGITTVTVLGNFDGTELGISFVPSLVHITLDVSTLVSNDMTVEANTLEFNSVALTTENNYASESPANLLSVDVDAIQGLRGTIIVPKDSVLGLDSGYNINNAFLGNLKESDPAYRARRYNELSRQGTSTAGGVREAVIDSIGSTSRNVSIIENDSDFPIPGALFPNEMPPHSFEVFVNADTDFNDAIAQAIYDAKSLGIEVVSTDGGGRTGLFTDANGDVGQVMPISSTVDVPIFITVQREKGLDYPSDGDDQIKSNLVTFINNLQIGDAVYNHRLFSPVNDVGDIIDLIIFADITSSPVSTANIIIDPFEQATLISVNVVVEDIP